MAVTYTNTVKDNRLQAVIDAIDAGAGPGVLEIGTAGMAAVLATITLADPSATKAAGVLTLSGVPLSAAASATGTAAEARIRDSNSLDVITGLTVGTSGTDIVLDNTSINSGQTVNVTAGTITHG